MLISLCLCLCSSSAEISMQPKYYNSASSETVVEKKTAGSLLGVEKKGNGKKSKERERKRKNKKSNDDRNGSGSVTTAK